ncbi:DUF6916 family protein [Aurantimonas endophytica]|uniref:DUF6916 domain-containing protein n=1 Tax=Aurantimonas endophytica TaxID=1522175 RepID=A0A7W6HCB0_9HYPH|nr:hypothetical protein [Aurantimonas endophytica]MBB4002544.1 hypothetical protein [Aurantimonas endophytica]MCO6403425.1 hypothetical protein [Aurantimonas endophytica]
MAQLTTLESAQASAGSAFEARAGAVVVPLVLDAVMPLGQGLRPDGMSFSLSFSGPAAPALAQGTVALVPAGEEGEGTPVFLVPVGRQGERMLYEAIFN